MSKTYIQRKDWFSAAQGGAPAAPAQLSGGGVPNSAMAEAIGGGYQSNMSGLEANMNQRMQAIQHPAAVSAVQQSVPLGTVQMLPEEEQAAPAQQQEEDVPFWINPFAYIRNKWRRYKARKAEEERIEAAQLRLKLARNRKKAWQMTEADFAQNEYNPGDKDEIAAIQQEIDEADTPEKAFWALTKGNGRLTFESEALRRQLDVNGQFKRRLKNMARMIVDYPELKRLVTNMEIREKKGKAATWSMAAKMKGTEDDRQLITGSDIYYYAENGFLTPYNPRVHNGTADYSGNHELGHILNGHLSALKQQDRGKGYRYDHEDADKGITASSMLKKVIRKLFGNSKDDVLVNENGQRVDMRPRKERLGQKYNRKAADQAEIQNRIDINASGFGRDFTASYGRTNAKEFFAEAFADVYANGATAKPASIRLVKEYERRRNKLTRRIESKGQRAGR